MSPESVIQGVDGGTYPDTAFQLKSNFRRNI